MSKTTFVVAGVVGSALWWALKDRTSPPQAVSLPILPSDNGPPPLNHGTQGVLSFLFTPVSSSSRMVKVELVLPPGYSDEQTKAELAELGMTEAEVLRPRLWPLVWLSPDMAWGVVTPPMEDSGKPWPTGTMIDARRKGW